MSKIRPFRYWYYLRTGYQLYFAFVFAAVNTMVVTYYLAIERAPFLKELFPSFFHYAIILIIVGIPILVLAGFVHFKKVTAFKSEMEISTESNPYLYKLPPGFTKTVAFPYNLLMSEILLKIAANEKITEKEISEMRKIQKQMEHLINGGYIGMENSKLPFKDEEKIT